MHFTIERIPQNYLMNKDISVSIQRKNMLYKRIFISIIVVDISCFFFLSPSIVTGKIMTKSNVNSITITILCLFLLSTFIRERRITYFKKIQWKTSLGHSSILLYYVFSSMLSECNSHKKIGKSFVCRILLKRR